MTEATGSAAAGTPDAAATAAAAAAAAASTGDWTTGLAPEVKSMIEVKGYKTPNDLGAAYINAEKAIGADKLVLPGKDAKPEEWDAVHERLGWPKAKGAEGYQFAKPEKLPEGFAYSDELAKGFAKYAHAARLTPAQAQAVHDGWVADRIAEHNATLAKRTEGQTTALAALKTELGTAFDTKLDLGKRAMLWAGGDALKAFLDGPDALGNNVPLIKAFIKIGEAMGETMADGMGAKPQDFAKTPEEAKAEIARIRGEATKDPKHALNDRWNPEHQAMVDKLEALHKQAFPEPAVA